MKKYKIVLDREGCIGAAACVAVHPERWKMKDDGKVSIQGEGVEKKDGNEELIITEEELELHKEAAEVCPVNVIHIIDLETGKKLI